VRKIVIIGGGFAGLSVIQELWRRGVRQEVTLIDRKAHFNFLPLLPDVIGRDIHPSLLVYPLEKVARDYRLTFIQDEVVSLREAERKIVTRSGQVIEYDILFVASGTQTNFYGNEQLNKEVLTLDSIQDAITIRRRIESAVYNRYIVIGGGYTGIEVATHVKRRLICRGDPDKEVLILERAPDILGPLPQAYKVYVKGALQKLNIQVLGNVMVDHIEKGRVSLKSGQVYEDALVLWMAGVRTADFVGGLSGEKNPQGRLMVDSSLRLSGNIFVVGDCAFFQHRGSYLRMAVQFAMTQGITAARNYVRKEHGATLCKYWPVDFGYIVPLANNVGCGKVMGLTVTGLLAVIVHYAVCVYRSYGLRNRIGLLKDLLKGGATMDLPILVLRICLGVVFIAHGLQKTVGMFSGPGMQGFSQFLAKLGFQPPWVWAYMAGYTELLGGVCLLLGVGTRISASLLFVLICIAAAKVHISKGFFLANGGFEYTFVIACVCLVLILSGGGKYCIIKNNL
jgi:NADH dehydrogenase